MAFTDEFADMMPQTLTAQPGTEDAFGDFTPSGEALSLSCRIEGESKLVRDETGQEVVSSVQAIIGGHNDLATHGYRYTLPEGFNPRTNLQAIGVVKVSDEDGDSYEEVVFP